jgi:RNA polymerase sigma factor (sigma-70 family)
MGSMPALSTLVRREETSRAVRGDSARFAAIYRRHHQALYRYCRSIVRHDEDAHDALQNTFEKAFTALQDEERDFELKPWLFRIAHNEAISLLRRRRETSDLDVATDIGRDTLPQRLDEREELRTLREDLDELPERQRAALVLRELSGLSHEEIAAALDSTPKAVKAAIFEARSALLVCREGRAMACEDIRRVLSDGDGRARRGRALRAHLRTCNGCRDFERALGERPRQLAALAPPLPAAASAALLAKLLPGVKGVLGGTAGADSAGVAATAGGGLAVKATVVAVIGATAAVGGAEVVRHSERHRATPPPARSAPATAAPARATPLAPEAAALKTPSLPKARATHGRPANQHVTSAGATAHGNRSHGRGADHASRGHHAATPAPANSHGRNGHRNATKHTGAQPTQAHGNSGQAHGHQPTPSAPTHQPNGHRRATKRPTPGQERNGQARPDTTPHDPAATTPDRKVGKTP